jgi:hypothetical protein
LIQNIAAAEPEQARQFGSLDQALRQTAESVRAKEAGDG